MLRERSRLVLAFVFVLLACPPRAGWPAAVTLEGLLAAPFPSELLASPTGGKLAWVQNANGVRNLWVAEPPGYKGRQVTRYTSDDGQALGGLEWTRTPRASSTFAAAAPTGRGKSPTRRAIR